MILFTVLLLVLLLLVLFIVISVSVLGTAGIILFGDIIVCIAIIVFIMKKLIEKKKNKRP